MSDLSNFKQFVSRQPAGDRYPYCSSCDCAVARFLKSENRYEVDWLGKGDRYVELNSLAAACVGDDLDASQWTFGALLERIEARERELAEVEKQPKVDTRELELA